MEALLYLFLYTSWIWIPFFLVCGIYQPTYACFELYVMKRMNSSYAIGLKRYLMSVVGYFVFLAFSIQYGDLFGGLDDLILFQLIILPWAFIIWFHSYTKDWKKKLKNIEAYDQEALLNEAHPDRLLLDSFPKKKFEFKAPQLSQQKDVVKPRATKIVQLPLLTLSK